MSFNKITHGTTDIKRVTFGDQEIWSADLNIPNPYNFETGDMSRWDTSPYVTADTTHTHSGNYSGLLDISNSGDNNAGATVKPFDGDGEQISQFKYNWFDTNSGHGGGIRLFDSNNNPVVGFSSDNNQWDIDDGNGITEVQTVNTSVWTSFTVTFNWSDETFNVYFEDDDGATYSDTNRPLKQSTDIAEIRLETYNNGNWSNGDSTAEIWFDDISVFTTLNTVVDSFEDGDLSEWNNTNHTSIVSDRVYNGSNSLYISAGTGSSYLLGQRDLGTGVSSVQLYWQETSSSYGHGYQFLNDNGERVAGAGTANPQWVYINGGNAEQLYSGDGYDKWIRLRVDFDYSNNNVTYTFEDTQSGTVKSTTVNMDSTGNVTQIQIVNTDNGDNLENQSLDESGYYGRAYIWTDHITRN